MVIIRFKLLLSVIAYYQEEIVKNLSPICWYYDYVENEKKKLTVYYCVSVISFIFQMYFKIPVL